MLDPQSRNSRLSKVSVACKTCDVSESFYSESSVKRFRLEHVGHDVLEGGVESAGKVRMLKVMVELVMLPAYPVPRLHHHRSQGGLEERLRPGGVSEPARPGQGHPREGQVPRFRVQRHGLCLGAAVNHMSEGATLAMSFGPSSSVGPDPVEPNPAAEEPLRNDAPSTSAHSEEIEIAPSGGEQSALVISEACSSS